MVDSQRRQAVLYGLLPDTLYAITVQTYKWAAPFIFFKFYLLPITAITVITVVTEDGGEEAEIVGSQQRQAVLYGLLPDTLYAITVRAYNKGGASPSSDPVFIRTDLTGEAV